VKGRKSRFECTASNGVNKRQRRVQLERCKNKCLQVRARKRSKSRKAAGRKAGPYILPPFEKPQRG